MPEEDGLTLALLLKEAIVEMQPWLPIFLCVYSQRALRNCLNAHRPGMLFASVSWKHCQSWELQGFPKIGPQPA